MGVEAVFEIIIDGSNMHGMWLRIMYYVAWGKMKNSYTKHQVYNVYMTLF